MVKAGISTFLLILKENVHSPLSMIFTVGFSYMVLIIFNTERVSFYSWFVECVHFLIMKMCSIMSNDFSASIEIIREGNGTPLQYSCLENPMDRGAWEAAFHEVVKSWTRLSDFPSLLICLGSLGMTQTHLSNLL